MTVLWGIIERDRSIVVLTVIKPLRHLRHRLTSELLAIKVAHKILGSTSTKRTTRIDVTDQHPLVVYLKQVWAFPYTTVIAVLLAKRTLVLPFLQILRRIDAHLLTGCQDKVPGTDILIPEWSWIAEIRHVTCCQHRVATVFLECTSTIFRHSHRLHLMMASRSIKGNDLVTIRYTRTAEDATQPVGLQSHRLMLPMNQVARCRVPPVHILPLRTIGVILIIEVPHTILIEHTVRIVHPSIERRMMIGRTETLTVGGVEGVGELYILPADELAHSTLLTSVSTKFDIEQTGTLQLVRHIIVHPVNGQLHIQSLHHVVLVVQYCNRSYILRFLHGQEHILLTLFHLQHGMTVAQHHRCHLSLSRCRHQHRCQQ